MLNLLKNKTFALLTGHNTLIKKGCFISNFFYCNFKSVSVKSPLDKLQ
jgi:hypothetical protein